MSVLSLQQVFGSRMNWSLEILILLPLEFTSVWTAGWFSRRKDRRFCVALMVSSSNSVSNWSRKRGFGRRMNNEDGGLYKQGKLCQKWVFVCIRLRESVRMSEAARSFRHSNLRITSPWYLREIHVGDRLRSQMIWWWRLEKFFRPLICCPIRSIQVG